VPPGWVVGDSRPAPRTAVVGLGTPGWAGGAPPHIPSVYACVCPGEPGGLCIVSKRSPALSHANAALKAAPCQTDEIVALFRLLLDRRRGKGPQHPQPGLGGWLCLPPRPQVLPIPAWGAARSGIEQGWAGRAKRDAGGIVRQGGQRWVLGYLAGGVAPTAAVGPTSPRSPVSGCPGGHPG